MTRKKTKIKQWEAAGVFILMAAVMAIAGVSCIRRKHTSPVDPVVSAQTPSPVATITPTSTISPDVTFTSTPTPTEVLSHTSTSTPTEVLSVTYSPTVTFSPTNIIASWTYTPTYTPTATFTETTVGGPFIDDFEDGDWVSDNGPSWWSDQDAGGASTITIVNTNADSAPVLSRNLRASGLIQNDEPDGTDFQGWVEAGVGTAGDPLIGLIAGTHDFIHFWMKGTTLPEANTNTDYRVRILMADGDIFELRLDYCVSQGIWREFTADLNDFTEVAGNPNPLHTYSGDEGGNNIVGWSVMAITTGGTMGSASGAYDFSLDAVEFMISGIADPLPPGSPLFDDFEDSDEINSHCYDWRVNTYATDATINTPATISDSSGGKPASEVLDMGGTMTIPAGRNANAGLNVKLNGPSAQTYKQLRFYIKGQRLHDILWDFYDDFSMTIYMDDGDQYNFSYIDACYTAGHGTINATTWTQITIDLTDSVTLVPVPAGHGSQGACLQGSGDPDFGSETANVTSFTIGQWSSQDPGETGPWSMQIDDLTFIP